MKRQPASHLKPVTFHVVRALAVLSIVVVGLSVLQVLALRWINPPFTAHMLVEKARCKMTGRSFHQPDYRWRNLDDISIHLRQAVLAAEDQRFLDHKGFDYREIKNAFDDAVLRYKFRGASTISMQTARMVFLPYGRTVFRKAGEAYYTVLIERLWPKARILEMYLNTVDWGPHTVGAEAAANRYFRTSAKALLPEQAALLAAVLPSPHRLKPNRPSDRLIARQKKILADMRRMPTL